MQMDTQNMCIFVAKISKEEKGEMGEDIVYH